MMVFDVSVGLLVLSIVLQLDFSIESGIGLLAAAAGGITPDAIEFLYYAFKKEPFKTHHWFHTITHSKIIIPHSRVAAGVLLQLPFVILSVGILIYRFL